MEAVKRTNKSLRFPASAMLVDGALIVLDLDSNKQFEVAEELVSDDVKRVIKKNVRMDNLLVNMSEDHTRVFGVQPYSGSFLAVFRKFAAQSGQVPAPYWTQPGERFKRDGTKFFQKAQYKFNALYEIVGETPYVGMYVVQSKLYLFAEGAGGKAVVDAYPTTLDAFCNWLDMNGTPISSLDLDYKDNLLPALEVIMQANAKVVTITLKNGWLNDMNYPPTGIPLPVITPMIQQVARPNLNNPFDEPFVEGVPVVPQSSGLRGIDLRAK